MIFCWGVALTTTNKKIYILNIFVPQQSYWANKRKDKAKNATWKWEKWWYCCAVMQHCKNNLCPAVNPSQSFLINEETESTTYEITLGITSEGYSLLRQRLLLFSSSLTWTDGTFIISDVTRRCIAEEKILNKSVLFPTYHIMDKTS